MTMQFTDFPPCKHRFGCLQCRNDIKFVEHMKKRFGNWECPENIPFGTPLEKLPEHIKVKHETYQNRLIQQGRPTREIPKENQIGTPKGRNINARDINARPNNFTETPGCIHRMMCVDCRNNESFRQKVESQMGPWECPENIPIGTKLEDMPKPIQEIHYKRQEQTKIQQEKIEKVKAALNSIEEVIPKQALGLLDLIRAYIFPQTAKSLLCKFNTGEKKEVDEICCGGKIKKVTGFICEKQGDASEKKCRSCNFFESKR